MRLRFRGRYSIRFLFLYYFARRAVLRTKTLCFTVFSIKIFVRSTNSRILFSHFLSENVFVCSKKFYEEKFQNCDDYVCPMILPGSSEKRRNIEQYLIDNNINYSVEIEIPNSTLLKKLIINDMGIGYINKAVANIEKGLGRMNFIFSILFLLK